MFISALIYFYIITTFSVNSSIIKSDDIKYESINPIPDEKLLKEDKNYWFGEGEKYLKKIIKLDDEIKLPVAKNVIIFIGDGMGISTITATRIYKGQREFGKSGEDHSLVYETFPNVGLVKTYNVDKQVPDSAGTATALFTGIKTRFKVLGLDVNCNKTFDKEIYERSKLESIMDWAQRAQKDTGIITTTRITHATPAATYAKINHRDWECDSEIPRNYRQFVKDISRQLIEDEPGKNFKVILGGGYQQFGYKKINETDECMREDGLNLTKAWLEYHKNHNAVFVTDNEGLEKVDENTDYLFGLFHANHLPYELIRDKGPKGTPSLTEMTRKGLQILKKSVNGFVLLVEGGRIDHGHHKNYARLALGESAEFDNAISLAVNETDSDTLIIVTADHSHGFLINSYGKRGNDILGFGETMESNKISSTLSYGNGRGFRYHYQPNETDSILYPWRDARLDETRLTNPYYRHMSAFDLKDETHAGEDVGIFAKGPGSHLIRGLFEQNYVAHVVSYAACIGPHSDLNPYCSTKFIRLTSTASSLINANFIIIPTILFTLIYFQLC